MDHELAIALSARQWPDDLNRFLADHGGARVRVTAVRPEDLATEAFDVLLVDDICSFLTPRLVELVRDSGRAVLGVFDPGQFPEGKDRLLECGVSDVVESDADPDEFLAAVARVAPVEVATPLLPDPRPSRQGLGRVVGIGGPRGGVGITEVAVLVASRLSRHGAEAVLVDADLSQPAVAQRLSLPLHPNLLTAIDLLEQRDGDLWQVLHRADGFGCLVGASSAGLRPRGVGDLVETLASAAKEVVFDLGASLTPASRELLARCDEVVAVAAATPVGIARLLEWVGGTEELDLPPIHLVVNRAPRDRYRRGEVVEEVKRVYRPASLVFLPEDPLLAEAGWAGCPAREGRAVKAVDRWLERFLLRGTG